MKHLLVSFLLLAGLLLLTTPGGVSAQSIAINSAAPTAFCNGIGGADSISVSFTATGSFGRKNAFTLQLSDGNGSFSGKFQNLGSIIDSTGGTKTIGARMQGLGFSAHYRVRIQAAVPYTLSADNGTDITIATQPSPIRMGFPSAGIIDAPLSFLCMDNGLNDTIFWDFGADATPPTITRAAAIDWGVSTFSASYSTGGMKTATFRVVSPGGCTFTQSASFFVFDCSVPSIPHYAKVIANDTSVFSPHGIRVDSSGHIDSGHGQNGQVYWVNPGVTFTDRAQADTIFAESGATIIGGDAGFIYLLQGATASGSGNSVDRYAPGASVIQAGIAVQCSSLHFDYTNAPPNKAVPFAAVQPDVAVLPILIAPNPTGGMLAVRNIPESIQRISVLNVLGAQVMEIAYPRSASVDLDLSKLAPGTYYVRLATGNSVITRKIVRE